MYQFMLFIHVVAAMTWVGSAIREEAVRPLVASASPEVRAAVHRTTVAMGTRLYAPAAVVALVSGIWLVSINDAIGFGATFVSIGFLMVIVGAVLGPAVFGRRGERAAEHLDGGDVAAAEEVERSTRPFELGHLALLLVTVLSMVWAWGA